VSTPARRLSCGPRHTGGSSFGSRLTTPEADMLGQFWSSRFSTPRDRHVRDVPCQFLAYAGACLSLPLSRSGFERTACDAVRPCFRIASPGSRNELRRLRPPEARAAYTLWAVQPIAKSDRNVTRLRSAPFVAVVQPANLRSRDHAASRWRHDRTGNGCILVQAEVSACS
jgi:hypothetical protein